MNPLELLTTLDQKIDEVDTIRAQLREARSLERTASFFEILLAGRTIAEREHVGDAIQLGNGWCVVHWKFAKRRGVAFYESIKLLGIAMHIDGEFLLNLADTSEERRPKNSRASLTQPSFTPAQRRVLIELGHGLTNDAIAQRLKLSPNTVKNVLCVLYKKLEVNDRTQAALRVRDMDLVTDAQAQ